MPSRPNILLITCDQYRFPRFSYGPDAGFAEPLKQILGFQGEVDDSNPYAKFFPGLLRLRKNAVVFRNHTIAASACTPSRATIYTGQYGTRTGVTQTDGLFKNGDSSNFPWLEPDGIPTLGSWMREAGYTTHYFGKWHVSNPPDHSLKRYGFDDWESSYPEPHGSQPNNLGIYRDEGFTDSACAFIRRRGLALNYNRAYAEAQARNPDAYPPDPNHVKPWFAVASFTNPHDIATYPGVIAQALPRDKPAEPITLPDGKQLPTPSTQSLFGPLTVPNQGDVTPPPIPGTMQLPLNPLDFPQDCARASPTQNESLADKPSCQRDYAYKMGLALSAKAGFNITNQLSPDDLKKATELAVFLALQNCIPFQLAAHPDLGCLRFLQLYAWLHSVVDQHIDAVLTALEESGQADNTIVIFLTDHGEYGGAHGMMLEKWHTAYQEALHVPVVIKPLARPLVEQQARAAASDSHQPVTGLNGILRQVDALTSHIDILPTILGLAGVHSEKREQLSRALAESRPVPPLPGVDLSPLIRGYWDPRHVVQPDGTLREGVLFITDDEITAPLPPSRTAQEVHSYKEFEVYKATVEAVREGTPNRQPVHLSPGSVRQPNHVRCVRTMDYKLARYFDPSGAAAQEWELYDLSKDPNEAVNLVQVGVTPPTARPDLPTWTDPATVQAAADRLAILLAKLEKRDL
ncbi:sulfatase-like hydrolase/transferase [Hyalangium versicolor]|uniref:sulfatase-like hydrolase/transferase n=1 Tax=Hyalangium versicolor TaxID=2861190 RepID=UPI001CCB4E5D|nr:sulfatase-like hydrolase/transferase [Hyalangium versicolor]